MKHDAEGAHVRRVAVMTWYAGPGDELVFRGGHGASPLKYELKADTTESGADRTLGIDAANFSAAVVANACAIRALSPPDVDALVLVLPTASDAVVRAIERTGARVVRAEIMPMLDARRQYGLRANDTSFRIRAIDFSKLWAFLMVDYDRLLFLDADALLMRDVNDALLRNASYRLTSRQIGAHYRPFPRAKKMPEGSVWFQAGVLLIKPSTATFGDLMLRFWRGDYEAEPASVKAGTLGDQSLLARHFTPAQRVLLPASFNCRNCQVSASRTPHVLHSRSWLHDPSPLLTELLARAERGRCAYIGSRGATIYDLLRSADDSATRSVDQLFIDDTLSPNSVRNYFVNECPAPPFKRFAAPFSNRSDGRRKWFFDLGANHGQSVRYFRSKVPDPNDWNIWSFDCNPQLYPLICLEMHGLTHAMLVGACVSNVTEQQTFFVDKANDVSSTLLESKVKLPKYSLANETWISRDVRVLRFRDVLRALVRPDDFCFVKFDVEGAEYAIIPDLLTNDSDLRLIDVLALEWHARFYPNGVAVEAQMRVRLAPYDIPRMDMWDAAGRRGWNATALLVAEKRSELFSV